jgi:hypothetical protein
MGLATLKGMFLTRVSFTVGCTVYQNYSGWGPGAFRFKNVLGFLSFEQS